VTNEQLAEAAYATNIAQQELEHQLRMQVLARTRPGREMELVRMAHEEPAQLEELAERALAELDAKSRGELLAVARRDVRMALLAAANSVLLTAARLQAQDRIDPEQVALFAACPIGWIRGNYTALPPPNSWVWRTAPEDRT
jgi:hypothetical protein